LFLLSAFRVSVFPFVIFVLFMVQMPLSKFHESFFASVRRGENQLRAQQMRRAFATTSATNQDFAVRGQVSAH
jgi:hypothetical protein